MLGLPAQIKACLFDMDGVLTETATLHAAAWKQTFDDFLRGWATEHGEDFVPFDANKDYGAFVDGKRRLDGVRDFLASRNITVPEGSADDGPEVASVNGIGTAKNNLVQELIAAGNVKTYDGSVAYLHAVHAAGLKTAVVSSSANTAKILEAAGLTDDFAVRVDGLTARELNLPGKPAPDMFLLAAQRLGVEAHAAAVFEDALAGVAAGRAGGFGLVIGVNRLDQAAALHANGADIVVDDLAELLTSNEQGSGG